MQLTKTMVEWTINMTNMLDLSLVHELSVLIMTRFVKTCVGSTNIMHLLQILPPPLTPYKMPQLPSDMTECSHPSLIDFAVDMLPRLRQFGLTILPHKALHCKKKYRRSVEGVYHSCKKDLIFLHKTVFTTSTSVF